MSYPIELQSHHLEMTPAIKEYALEKVGKVLGHVDGVIKTTIRVSMISKAHGLNQLKAQIVVQMKGRRVVLSKVGSDLYAALDAMSHSLHEKLMKLKAIRQSTKMKQKRQVKRESSDLAEM